MMKPCLSMQGFGRRRICDSIRTPGVSLASTRRSWVAEEGGRSDQVVELRSEVELLGRRRSLRRFDGSTATVDRKRIDEAYFARN